MGDAKQSALRAFRLLFRPVARLLLRAGVNWRDVAEAGKATYVEIATEDYGIRGRPTNISRVAILTGFTRREVRRLRDLLAAEEPDTFGRMNYATRVLSAWWQDEDFLDCDGKPRKLAVHGDEASFDALCHRYSGDVPATTLLKELKHVGAVVETKEGTLSVKSRFYMPVLMDPEQMMRSGSVLEDIGETVAYNLHRTDEQPSRFERRATNTNMSAATAAAFRDYLEKEGQGFLEKVDAWLTEHECDADEEGPRMRLGLGAYWIQDDDD